MACLFLANILDEIAISREMFISNLDSIQSEIDLLEYPMMK